VQRTASTRSGARGAPATGPAWTSTSASSRLPVRIPPISYRFESSYVVVFYGYGNNLLRGPDQYFTVRLCLAGNW
jgi:hypothetical protein